METRKLAGIGFFSGLSKKELDKLAQWTDEIDVPAGTELAAEGHFAHEFFVIEEGAATVTQGGNRIAELGPGDFFGEIGLIETERRTATVLATTPRCDASLSASAAARSTRRATASSQPLTAQRALSGARSRPAKPFGGSGWKSGLESTPASVNSTAERSAASPSTQGRESPHSQGQARS